MQKSVAADSERGPFHLTILLPPEEARYVRLSSLADFTPEALDASVQFRFSGGSPAFLPDDPRVTSEGALSNVPVFDFLQSLLAACAGLQGQSLARERAYVTSTDYALEFYRDKDTVEVRLVHVSPDKSVSMVAVTTMDVRALVRQCADICRAFLTALSDMNAELRREPRLRNLEAKSSSIADLSYGNG